MKDLITSDVGRVSVWLSVRVPQDSQKHMVGLGALLTLYCLCLCMMSSDELVSHWCRMPSVSVIDSESRDLDLDKALTEDK